MRVTTDKAQAAVLIVDDDPVCRLFCSRALAAAGYPTLTAKGYSDAVRLALRERPSIILVDLHLEYMSGIEAKSGILGSWPDAEAKPRFICLSGDDSTGARTKILDAGIDLVLAKPLCIEALLDAVRAVENQQFAVAGSTGPAQHVGTMYALPENEPVVERELQSVFLDQLERQLRELDQWIALPDWKQAMEVLHRLCGAAALAGFAAFSSGGRLLLRQLERPQDFACLAENYLDFLGQAADLVQ